ncbi:hypothetical protein BX600DRAFT_468599 [Xylariales sp. PMI_506]|nr:hypothetical protein BX600DRAFT_468599 [Xylariales sp. PMI_506]
MDEDNSRRHLHDFPRFPDLPPELRLQIWWQALRSSTANRTIRVAVYNELQDTRHWCTLVGRPFCGRHDRCTLHHLRLGNHWRFKITACLSNGYFAVKPPSNPARTAASWMGGARNKDADLYEPDDAASRGALLNLSLACRETREVVLSAYPRTMRVYRSRWNQRSHLSRLVRCDPAHDLLLIAGLDTSRRFHSYPESGRPWPGTLAAAAGPQGSAYFPPHAAGYHGYRDVLSCWQRVAFVYEVDVGGPAGESPQSSANRRPGGGPIHDPLFPYFLFSLESLRHLAIRIEPLDWPQATKDVPGGHFRCEHLMSDAQHARVKQVSLVFLSAYNSDATFQNEHWIEEEGHWVPKPKLLHGIETDTGYSWEPVSLNS